MVAVRLVRDCNMDGNDNLVAPLPSSGTLAIASFPGRESLILTPPIKPVPARPDRPHAAGKPTRHHRSEAVGVEWVKVRRRADAGPNRPRPGLPTGSFDIGDAAAISATE